MDLNSSWGFRSTSQTFCLSLGPSRHLGAYTPSHLSCAWLGHCPVFLVEDIIPFLPCPVLRGAGDGHPFVWGFPPHWAVC